MKLEVNDKEFQAWANAVRATIADQETKKAVERQLGRVGGSALKIFKENTPVKSGHLRRKWDVNKPFYTSGGWKLIVRNSADYARYVEYGHRQTPGRYVPDIKKRLVKSWVEGQFYNRTSAEELQSKIGEIMKPVEKAFNETLDRQI